MEDIFKEYEPSLLDHLLNMILAKSDTEEPATDMYLLAKTKDDFPDRIALMTALSDIGEFDPYLIQKGEFIYLQGDVYYAGKGLEEFLIQGGFQGILKRQKDIKIRAVEKEKLEVENLQTSIASGKAAIKSEKHAKSSKYAAWLASIISMLAILTTIGIAWWQGAQNEDLKKRIEHLENRKPLNDTLVIKDTSFLKKTKGKFVYITQLSPLSKMNFIAS